MVYVRGGNGVHSTPVIRRQIYIDAALARRLRRAAAARGRTASALIREAVHRYLDDEGPPADDPIRAFIGGSTGGPADASVEHDRYLYGSDR